MAYFIVRECSCGTGNTSKEVSEAEFEKEISDNDEGSVSVEGDNEYVTYYVSSCKTCRAE